MIKAVLFIEWYQISQELQEYRSNEVQEQRSTGVLEYWSIGVLECWSARVGESNTHRLEADESPNPKAAILFCNS